MQRTLGGFEDVHTIVLFSVIAAPSSLRGGFVLKSKRHSPQDSLLREISPRVRQETDSEVQNREAEKLSWLAMDIESPQGRGQLRIQNDMGK